MKRVYKLSWIRKWRIRHFLYPNGDWKSNKDTLYMLFTWYYFLQKYVRSVDISYPLQTVPYQEVFPYLIVQYKNRRVSTVHAFQSVIRLSDTMEAFKIKDGVVYQID